MCYRFYLKATDVKKAATRLAAKLGKDLGTRYNIAPGSRVAALLDEGRGREVANLRWGLYPRGEWAAKPGVSAATLANARSETITEKPSFREAYQRRRCLVPASGFFEWETLPDGRKQPWLFHSADGEPLLFAALWDPAPPGTRGSDDEPAPAGVCLLTGSPNTLLARIHDRMPILLNPAEAAAWLDATAGREAPLSVGDFPCLPAEALRAHRCDPWMNTVGNDDLRGILPYEPPPPPPPPKPSAKADSGEQLGFGF